MHVGLLLPESETVSPIDPARSAEKLGYDSVWMGELWGGDALVRLATVAEHTDEIDLGTAIVNVFSRSPATLSMAAASLDRISDGRFVLGLGVSTPKAIADLHGMAYDRPIRRTHEVAELVRRFTSGDEGTVDFQGEVFETEDFPPIDADVPLYNAALGPANRRVTGRVFDGWIPHNVPFPDLPEAFETVADAAREAGRDPGDVTVAPYVPSAVSEDPRAARDAIRRHLAYYVGSGEGYRSAVGRRFPEEADRIAGRWQAGDHGGAADAVTDEMVRVLGVAGTPETARAQLEDLASTSVVDELLVYVPEPLDREWYDRTMTSLAPSNW